MNRRRFITGTALCAGVSTIAGLSWMSVKQGNAPLQINAVLRYLKKIKTADVETIGDWRLSKILNHCAQSVEYSMSGYPKYKSKIFRNTVGTIAFATFSAKKKMHHDLSEEIPGAPFIETTSGLAQAYARFEQSLQDFLDFSGVLQAHFAFGELTKLEYEEVHTMHFYNHLEEIVLKVNP